MKLSEIDKRILTGLARNRITAHLCPGTREPENTSPLPESLEIQCGVFVSLYVNSKLRGCIGTFSEHESLHNSVQNMALSAATSDSRFTALEKDELDRIMIEISVLTPRSKISEPGEIIIGKHGIYIQKGVNRGTLLPQVAINQNWDVEQFLGNCAKYKAGIGYEGWRDAEIYTYEAIVFNSRDYPPDC